LKVPSNFNFSWETGSFGFLFFLLCFPSKSFRNWEIKNPAMKCDPISRFTKIPTLTKPYSSLSYAFNFICGIISTILDTGGFITLPYNRGVPFALGGPCVNFTTRPDAAHRALGWNIKMLLCIIARFRFYA
jgi:hypothetical protein